MIRIKPSRLLFLMVPLAVLAVLGCSDATGPKFPDPIEEPEDSTIEEGMTRRWSMAPGGAVWDHMPIGVMPFTSKGPEST